MSDPNIDMMCSGTVGEALASARANGVDARLLTSRENGMQILRGRMSQYERIFHWWARGERLVRTLGPGDAR